MQILNNTFESLLQKEQHYYHNNEDKCHEFLFECFINNDSDLYKAMELISSNVDNYCEQFMVCYQRVKKDELNHLQEKLKQTNYDTNAVKHYTPRISKLVQDLKVVSLSEFLERDKTNETLWATGQQSCYSEYPEIFSREHLGKYARFYSAIDYLMQQYIRDKARREFQADDLKTSEDVKQLLISLYDDPNCLDRYDLLPIAPNCLFCVAGFSYIWDSKLINKYPVVGLSAKQVELITHLMKEGFITDFAVKVESVVDWVPAMEEKEYGQLFDYDLTNLPKQSKFYDVNEPEDNFWVKAEYDEAKTSLTFESTRADFECDEQHVITNLVHLEITQDGNKKVISHLDHEYIIYTYDQYEQRLKKPLVKGRDKIKTFKIDNAIIPYDHNYKGVPVLCSFIITALDHKSLIIEYFQNILSE